MKERYSEDAFKATFVKWFKQLYPKDHICQIESRMTCNGIPDTNLCKGGKEIWVELKEGDLNTSSIKAGQYIWHIKRNQAGGTTWIVQGYECGIIKVYNGRRIKEFRESPNNVTPCAMFDTTLPTGRLRLFTYLFS